MEFIFTLRYVLENSETTETELMERLAMGGCEDALVGVGQTGRLALEFSRQAANAQEAMRCSRLLCDCPIRVAGMAAYYNRP